MRLKYLFVFGMVFAVLLILFVANPANIFGTKVPVQTQTEDLVATGEFTEDATEFPTPFPITIDQLVTPPPTSRPTATFVPTQEVVFDPVDPCDISLYSMSFNMNIRDPLSGPIDMTAESFYSPIIPGFDDVDIVLEGGCVFVSDPSKEKPWAVFVGIKTRERLVDDCPYFDDVVIGSKNFDGEFGSSGIEMFFSYFHSGMTHKPFSSGCDPKPSYHEGSYMWDGLVLGDITQSEISGEVWAATADNKWLVGTFKIDR